MATSGMVVDRNMGVRFFGENKPAREDGKGGATVNKSLL
jgi:hypothetical protein